MIKATFNCIDAHTCGNPVRLVTDGHPDLKGATMSEKRLDFMDNYDWIRKALMFEPRGHDMMSGGFIYPACTDNADASLLFIETSGCLPMCGHGTIGMVTAGLEAGLITAGEEGKLILDVPAGKITVHYEMMEGKVNWVKIFNIASYLAYEGINLDVPELGSLTVDVGYGGNYYIIVEPQQNFSGIEHWSAADILRYSPLVRDAVNDAVTCIHPEDPSVRGASHLLWTGTPTKDSSDAANAVFYGDKAIDRSPCGTGTSARMAQLFTKGALNVGDDFVHESYIGSQFFGRVEKETTVGDFRGIFPSIKGSAHVYGKNIITIDDSDPYAFGFQVI